MSELHPDRAAGDDSDDLAPTTGSVDPPWIGPSPSLSSRATTGRTNVVPIGREEPPSLPLMTVSALRTEIDELRASLPVLLTIEEAAEVLRIGRSLAYDLAHRYEASGGLEGLPVLRFGSCLRVPRWALIERVVTGRVVPLDELQGR